MLPRLEGRAIFITGAGSGIGRATALLAVKEGAMVAAVDVDAEGLNSTVDAVRLLGGQIAASVADVSDRKALAAAIDSMADEVGPLHGVFANAAVLPSPVPIEALDWQEWDRFSASTSRAPCRRWSSSLSHVVDGGSLLVNGSSMAIRPREGRLAYVAAKAGLHAAARALALRACTAADQSERGGARPHGHTDGPAHPGSHRERASERPAGRVSGS